jgi:uncharacterized protein (UPF0332 family)
MSFDNSGFYKVAVDLIKLAKNSANAEAFYRSAISRAYYAAFLKARYYLRTKGKAIPRTKGTNPHQFVADEIAKISYEGWEISESLKTLREERNDADYGNQMPNLPMNAPLLVESARIILEAIDKLP